MTDSLTAALATTSVEGKVACSDDDKDNNSDSVSVSPIRYTNGRCCQKCEAMTGTPEGLRALLSDDGYTHLDLNGIRETAAMGCAFCKNIRYFFELYVKDILDKKARKWIARTKLRIYAEATGRPSVATGHSLENFQLHKLVVKYLTDDGDDEDDKYFSRPYGRRYDRPIDGQNFYPVAFEGDAASGFVLGRRESKELSASTVDEIRRWLDDCFASEFIGRQHNTPELPQRVVDVGSEGSPTRLYEPKQGETGRYAALSYCWGYDVPTITTTTSNIREHMLAFPDHLPQTISDAVEVCRKIGIQYLWVDALCIMQDNEDNKRDQIAQMGSIFKNSMVTIAIASAAAVTDGFLSNGKSYKPVAQLPFFVNTSTSGMVYLRGAEFYSDEIRSDDQPLFQRAWTFQEILLSPRVLLFDSYQINVNFLQRRFQSVPQTCINFAWRCQDLPVSVFGLEDEESIGLNDVQREDYIRNQQYKIWKNVINEYSGRDITLWDDRLPALAGIATELAKSWNDVYLVGFWKKTIVRHLGWSRNRSGPEIFTCVDRTRRIASPSWAWVTIPFSVYVRDMKVPDAKLVDSGVEPVSEKSPFGQVTGAFIALDARILDMSDVSVNFSDDTHRSFYRDRLDFEEQILDEENCKYVFLGQAGSEYTGTFLIVEKSANGDYQRVGMHLLYDAEVGWRQLISKAKREVIVIR